MTAIRRFGHQGLDRPGFRPDIEGLRALAIVAVVLYHAGVPGVGGGFVGVDVFFVISGYLITGMLCREMTTTGTVRLGRFYGARARRLLPASATVGVATAIASAVLLPPLQARTVLGDGIASALYVGNYRFALQDTDYLAADTLPLPFRHYWSLGVEEQFYLLWPLLIIGTTQLSRRTRTRGADPERPYLLVLALVAAISFAVSLAWTHTAPMWAFFSLPTRAWELAAGGLVALTESRWHQLPALPATAGGWGGLGLVLVACTRLSLPAPFPGTAALLPVLGTALVIGCGCAPTRVGAGRVLSLPPMRAIGRMSYSWYLWHVPLMMLMPIALDQPLGTATRLATVPFSAGLAVLTLHLIENPARFAAALRRSAAASLALGAAATAVAVCVALTLLMLCPSRSTAAWKVTSSATATSSTADAPTAIRAHALHPPSPTVGAQRRLALGAAAASNRASEAPGKSAGHDQSPSAETVLDADRTRRAGGMRRNCAGQRSAPTSSCHLGTDPPRLHHQPKTARTALSPPAPRSRDLKESVT